MRNTCLAGVSPTVDGDPPGGRYDRRVSSPDERRDAIAQAAARARGCGRCPQLAATRTQVVFGSGDPDADLLVVADAPGREEDERGVSLLGRPRRVLDELLRETGIDPAAVWTTTALLCRPPDNRDPAPAELERCRAHLLAQVELVAPRVVCTLGTVATRVVRGVAEPILRVHGRTEVVELAGRRVRVLPVLHPAAALYRPQTLELLRRDLARLPGLLALPVPEQPRPVVVPPAAPLPPVAPDPAAGPPPDGQLGLF
ncbi:hypothetical protein C7Y72_14550 [Paraconexibacter algicola]|uniref:Type-4 uracil-DNA glycosylase n=1 Tax=Paraconexibacter algicola TaxID=2133960 RepID=A0A2T4UEJ0_9ACTN|nr:hypothetical protein C7Y72_14550 [Paraconexibacter algicola]